MKKNIYSKIIASFLVILMIVGVLPFGAFRAVLAAEIGSYSIQLKTIDGNLSLDNVDITMTSKWNTSNTMTVQTENGVAVFENFVVQSNDYTISVADIVGYEAVAPYDITVGTDETSRDIVLTAITSVNVSGTVTDENGLAYEGAIVSVSGYVTTEITTDADGKYAFDTYVGKENTINIIPKDQDEQYEVIPSTATYSSDVTNADYQFAVKTYSINTTAGDNGAISASEDNIVYGSTRTINVVADDGYRIDKLTVNGEEKDTAVGQKTFDLNIDNIKQNYNIAASFYRMTYSITFTVDQHGKVTYIDGGTRTVDGGSVSVEKTFNESTDSNNPTKVSITATPSANYRVSKVIIDGNETSFTDNDYVYVSSAHNADLIMTQNHIFEVEFSSNEFALIATCGSHGIASWENAGSETTIAYGESTKLNIMPANGYAINSVTVNGVAVDFANGEDGPYISFDNVTEAKTVAIEFGKPDEYAPTDILTDEKYTITFSKETVKEPYLEAGMKVYVFPNDATVTVSPVSPYSFVKVVTANNQDMPYPLQWSETFNETTDIKKLYVASGYWGTGMSKSDVNIRIIIDKTAPVVGEITEQAWTNEDDITVSGTVTDEGGSGINYVVWSKDNQLSAYNVLHATQNKVAVENGQYSFVSESGEQNSIYYVYAVDYANNVSDAKTVQIKIDKTNPKITGFSFSTEADDIVRTDINHTKLGTICKKTMYLTVSAIDENVSAGLKSVTLYCGDTLLETKNCGEDESEIKFELTEEDFREKKEISAVVTDMAGNVSQKTKPMDESVTDNLGGIKSNNVQISSERPTAIITLADPDYIDKNGNKWYSGDVIFNVSAKDMVSGIRYIEVKFNGETVATDINGTDLSQDLSQGDESVNQKSVDVGYLEQERNGKNTIEVVVTNAAGQASLVYTKEIYIDANAPYITNFDFQATDYVEKSGNVTEESGEPIVITTDYGFYFKENTNVILTAKDGTVSSGINSITYYTVDYTHNVNGVKSVETTLPVNSSNQITVSIPANFKGQIYAKATDNVLNSTNEFITPNGTIIETQGRHDAEEYEHITFTKPSTGYTTNDGTELYNDNVDIIITVEDVYAGIREIEWSVVAPYDTENNQSGKLTINNDKSFATGSDSNWTIVDTEKNLVTKIKKTVNVKNNSNNIVLTVKMTDRAGNTTTKKTELSIDKTNPTITITYEQDDVCDDENTSFFSTKRTAIITVTERNFRASDIAYAITSTNSDIPTTNLQDENVWNTTKDSSNPDMTVHVAKIVFGADGDYTFDISYKDNAQRKANVIETNKFTIDMTIPEVSVSYNNNTALNENYYNADRIATITVHEHNFDPTRVKVIGVATNNGGNSTFPTLSSWKNSGNDTYTATLAYSMDAKYSFDIEVRDMANNSIVDFAMEEFYIDKTAPNLTITGVADKSANNGIIAPVITYSDNNFNKDAVTIKLSGVNNGADLKYDGAFANTENGQVFTYVNFEQIKEVDDIYTLTAKVIDMAGNETEATIVFSANRFGSVYNLSKLENILTKYLQMEQDIVFTETNVDSLARDAIRITLTKNGTPTDLIEGVDYTIDLDGGDGKWCVYTYTIMKELFADDGRYSIVIYSVDDAGNINENIDENKASEITFGIDKTNPVIVPIDIEDGVQYAVDMKTASVEVKDNLVLDDVKIYLNDQEIEYTVTDEICTFDIAKSNNKQNVKIVAIDAAGNEETLEISDFLVNASLFVRWYNNTPLFVGSIIAGVGIVLGATGFIVFGKKKR